ncbi:MAG: HAMP domain-containing histidine kinase [Myxococcales bacterium]|nr:HAMP domain-containing histidine kinase [Myxococcales bacterium]
MRRRSIGYPLALGITLAVVAGALAVGWQLLVVGDIEPVTRGLTPIHWTLVILGSVFFVLLIVGLLLLCAWLVREMRVNQRQEAFLDAVTHEMKTPLASLRLYLETLERRDPSPERRRVFVERMGQDIERLERTVNQVLVVARAEGAQSVRFESVDLRAVISECIDELHERNNLSEHPIELSVSGPGYAWGSREELVVIFRNLLANAVKYSAPRSRTKVTVEPAGGDRVRVSVSDFGIGIDRTELRKIFRRFYRTGRDVQQAAGLGLGLFIVRQLVRRQGGRVDAESEGRGKGSLFAVTLRTGPRGSAQPASSVAATESSA